MESNELLEKMKVLTSRYSFDVNDPKWDFKAGEAVRYVGQSVVGVDKVDLEKGNAVPGIWLFKEIKGYDAGSKLTKIVLESRTDEVIEEFLLMPEGIVVSENRVMKLSPASKSSQLAEEFFVWKAIKTKWEKEQTMTYEQIEKITKEEGSEDALNSALGYSRYWVATFMNGTCYFRIKKLELGKNGKISLTAENTGEVIEVSKEENGKFSDFWDLKILNFENGQC